MKVSTNLYGEGRIISSEKTCHGELYKVKFKNHWNGDEHIRYLFEKEFTFLGSNS